MHAAWTGRPAPASVPNNVSHPRYFRIGESNHGRQDGSQEMAPGVRAYRQQLIAATIANADTPGYQAVDIDFEEALRTARSMADMPPLRLSATTSGHISGPPGTFATHDPLKYQTP